MGTTEPLSGASPRPWRTGDHVPHNIYSPSDEDPRGIDIGRMDHPVNRDADAALVVAAVNAYGSPGPGHHVLVTVGPDRNHGRVSISRTMVPISAAAGVLRAGDPVELMRDEYGLTEAEAAVVAALADDFEDLFVGEEPSPGQDVCRVEVVNVDGRQETVVVRGREPMTALDKEMFAELVAAARRRIEATDPHIGIRQELAAAWMRIASRVPNGPEKDRLRAALKEAQAVLGPRTDGEGGDDEHVSGA